MLEIVIRCVKNVVEQVLEIEDQVLNCDEAGDQVNYIKVIRCHIKVVQVKYKKVKIQWRNILLILFIKVVMNLCSVKSKLGMKSCFMK